MNVLVLDDDDTILKLMTRIFTKLGCKSLCTNNIEEILRELNVYKTKFNLAFVDLTIPFVNLKNFLPMLKNACKDIKIIIISGLQISEEYIDNEITYDLILTKPFTFDDVKKLIEEYKIEINQI